MENDKGRIYYATGLDNSRLREDAAQARNILAGVGTSAAKEGDRIDAAMKKIGASIAGVFAVQQVKDFAVQVATVRGQFQQLEAAFKVLTGDAAHRIKAYNGFMTNLSKIRPDGKSYAVYNPDMINGGGFHSRSEEVRFSLASRFPRQTDSGLSRYVWVRLADTFLKDDTFTPFPQEKI